MVGVLTVLHAPSRRQAAEVLLAAVSVARMECCASARDNLRRRAVHPAETVAVTLTEVIARFEERATVAELEGATAPVANVYRLVLDELGRLVASDDPSPNLAPDQDRLLTVPETAERLGVTTQWIYRHAHRLPFTRRLSARALRFSEAGLSRYLERLR